jgi:hypothetical protein
MKNLDHLLNFFGNPSLDRHRLPQGRWDAYRIEWDDPDGWSDRPLELLLTILAEELTGAIGDSTPALRALDALAATALESLSHPEFSGITQRLWRGFQFVAQCAAQECGVVFRDTSRDDIRHLIESKYAHHAT